MIVLLLVVSLLLQARADTFHAARPPVENGYDVTPVLHGDDAHLVFFVHPDEEISVGSALDPPRFRPISRTPRSGQQGASSGLLEQGPHLPEFFRELGVHGPQGFILARQITCQFLERILQEVFHLEAVLAAGSWGQGSACDATACSHSGGLHILVDDINRV